MAGIDGLKSGVGHVAVSLNVLSKVLAKQGLWHLIELNEPIKGLLGLDLSALKAEVLDLSDEERKAIEEHFRSKLDLVNKDVQVKLGQALDLIEQAVAMVEGAVQDGIHVYSEVVAFIAKAKAFLGV